jgi:DNA-binding NarL/FixJ family response regulator
MKRVSIPPPCTRTELRPSVNVNMASQAHKIVIVDDHPLFREGLLHFINSQKGLFCCGSVDTSEDALAAIDRHKAELVILDLRLRTEDGLQVIRTLKVKYPEVAVLVLSQFNEATYGERALRAGASGFVTKEDAPEQVLEAIRTVLRGDIYASRNLAFAALKRLVHEKPGQQASPGPERLSDRELQVFEFIGRGRSIKEIAAVLNLSPKTIETYREHIKNKLALGSAAELARTATTWIESQA